MTPQDHNKMLGIMHLIYGGFFALMTLLMVVLFGFMGVAMTAAMANDPNAPPAGFFVALMGIFVVIYGLLSIPSLAAGYGMLKRRSWARTMGIVASVLSAISFPFGTALCVYSLWFFFGEAGKAFEQEQQQLAGSAGTYGALGGAPASAYGWGAQGARDRRAQEQERPYTPPAQPPSWRE